MKSNFGGRSLVQFCFCFLLLFALSFSPLAAQQSLGNITGTVTDASGAVVAGVRVKLLNTQTGLARTVASNSRGAYTFFGLPIGQYSLTFSRQGFKTLVHSKILVQANRTASVSAALQPGNVSTTINVSATPLLNKVDTTNGYILTPSTIKAIPLGTGSFTQLATLSPGVNSDFLSGSGTNAGLGNQEIWANGQRDTSNSFSFNGINSNNLFNGKSSSSVNEARFVLNTGEHFLPGGQIQTNTSVYDAIGQGLPTPPPETIEELRVNTSMYDASAGANSGAHIAVLTRSGTNRYHGQLYWYHQSGAWNAAPYFYNASPVIPQAQKVPALHRNVLGATLGGPIFHNKVFFYGSYQAVRTHDQLNGTSFVTVPFRLTNDRSAATLEQEFGVSSVNPVALKLLNTKVNGQYLIPTAQIKDPATAGNLGYNAIVQGNPSFSADQVNANLDFNLSQNDHLAGKYYFQRDPTISPFADSNLLGFPQQLRAGSQVFSLQNTSVLGPAVTWEQDLGFIREIAYANVLSAFTPASVGMNMFGSSVFPGINIRNISAQIPGASVRFGTAGSFTDGGVFQNQLSYSSNMNWITGAHMLQFGFNVSRIQLNVINRQNESPAGGITASNFNDFLTGTIRKSELLIGPTNRYYRANQVGAYAQDHFQLNHNLTLDLGLRWDYDGPLSEEHGLLTNFDPSLYKYNAVTDTIVNDGLVVAGNNPQYATAGASSSTLKAPQYGFSPRLGFAYGLKKNLVLRGGYGIYYDRGEFFTEFSPGAGGGISGPLGVTQELPFVVPFISPSGATLSSPFGATAPSVPTGNPALFAATLPNLTATAACPAGQIPNAMGCGSANSAPDVNDGGAVEAFLGGYGINNKLPYSENWTLDLQWQPSNTLAFTLGYTGNHGVHELLPIPINQPQLATPGHPVHGQIYSYGYNPCPSADPNCQPQNYSTSQNAVLVTEPFDNINGFGNGFYGDGGNVDLRVPYVGYNPNIAIWEADGISHYNALEFSVRKRLSHGLQINGSYTWSHALDEGSGLQLFYNGNNPLDPRSGLGNAGFDRTHVFAFSYLYSLPRLVSRDTSWAGRFLNGWGLSGVTTLESGQPYSAYDFTGAVGSLFYSVNDFITNPILPLKPGVTPQSTQTTVNGAPGLIATNFALPYAAPGGAQGVPPCGPTADGFSNNYCDSVETGYGATGRNIFRGPFQSQVNLTLFKDIKFSERWQLRYQADFFNLLNTPSFDAPQNNSGVNSCFYPAVPCYISMKQNQQFNGFGLMQDTIGSPRFIQMSLHLTF